MKNCPNELCKSSGKCIWPTACDAPKQKGYAAPSDGPRKPSAVQFVVLPMPKFDDIVKIAVEKGLKLKVTREATVNNAAHYVQQGVAKLADGTVVVTGDLTRSGNEFLHVNTSMFEGIELPHKRNFIFN